jgi:hypothetical protein
MPQPVAQQESPGTLPATVAFTPGARDVISAACQRTGQQVVLLAWPAGAAYLPVECYVPSEFDVIVAYVEGCPVYADTRRLGLFMTKHLVLDADPSSPGRPHPPLRASVTSLKRPDIPSGVHLDALAARVGQDLVCELAPQYAGVFTEGMIAIYVRAAVHDLRGSVWAEALPELAARLAHHRLADAARQERVSTAS